MILSTSRSSAVALLTMTIGSFAPAASAQTPQDGGSQLLLGPVSLRPTLMLRDAGFDSNIFNVAGGDPDDRTAILSGATDARTRVGLVQIDGTGSVEYLYFERHTQERAVNRFVTARVQPQFTRVKPFVGGGYRRTRDRANSEIDVRAPRTEHNQIVGVDAQVSTRATIQGLFRRTVMRFDAGARFRDIDLAARLNRDSDIAEVSFRYELSPLTTFTAGTSLTRDDFTDSPDRNTTTLHTTAGFEFAPDAIVRGRAMLGFRDLRPRGTLAIPSRGPTAGIELSYTLLERTLFAGRFVHERTVSVESHPFYLSTQAAFEVTHNLVGPLDVVARVARERLDYDAVAAFSLPAHLDRVGTRGGGIVVRIGPRLRTSAMYEDIQRRSDLPDVRDYDRYRLYTTISYGF